MTKRVRGRYTLQFKQEAVRLVTGEQSIAAAGRSLGVVDQTWARSGSCKLMQLHGIRAKGKRRFKITTDSKHELPIASNLLDRQFTSQDFSVSPMGFAQD